MTVNLPTAFPPPSLYPKLLPHLISQLNNSTPSSTTLPLLRTTLHIIASIQLSSNSSSTSTESYIPQCRSTIPLQSLLDFSTSYPSLIKVPTLLDAIIAYPLNISTINEILTNCFNENFDLIEIFRIEIIPTLINRLVNNNIKEISKSVSMLLSIFRSHDELLALALEDSENLFKSLSKSYKSISTTSKNGDGGKGGERLKIKSDILMICKELLDSVPSGHNTVEETMIKFMGDLSSTEQEEDLLLLGNGNSLRDDWENLFERNGNLINEYKDLLEDKRDEEAKSDPRVHHLLTLFPDLPPHLLLSALSHPTFSSLPEGSRATPSEQASPIVEIIFNGGEGLPGDLIDLKIAIQALSHDGFASTSADAIPNGNQPSRKEEKKKVERRNIFDNEGLDVSKLRLKDDDSLLPTLSNTIPDTLRDSIMRLVENQAIEEEERRQALKEANLLDDEDDYEEGDDGIISKIKVGGDTGGDIDEDEVSEEDGVKISREPSGTTTPSSGPSDRQRLDILRTTYITNQKVFERDGLTRRSNERKKLRELTGWDDGQIEGWRIMLERDPHKEDILAAHADRLSRQRANSPTRQNGESSRGRGGRGGRGGGGGNRGGSSGGRGGQGGGGSGQRGGRGASKGNRGHSNAARTRGHDKKMSKMGAI